MNNEEAQLSRDIARILDHAIICTHKMQEKDKDRVSHSLSLLNQAEADCLKLVSSRELTAKVRHPWELHIKRRVKEAYVRLLCRFFWQKTPEALHERHLELTELGYRDIKDKTWLEIDLALQCPFQVEDDAIYRTHCLYLKIEISDIMKHTYLRLKHPRTSVAAAGANGTAAYNEAEAACLELVSSIDMRQEREACWRLVVKEFALVWEIDTIRDLHEFDYLPEENDALSKIIDVLCKRILKHRYTSLSHTGLSSEAGIRIRFAEYCERYNRDELAHQLMLQLCPRLDHAARISREPGSYLRLKEQCERLFSKLDAKQA